MTITGRLTADAVVRETKNDKKVVGFSLANNKSYKKDGVRKTITTYFQCSYWINQNVAIYLTKGALVELNGDVNARLIATRDGTPKAVLTFSVDKIIFHSKGTETPTTGNEPKAIASPKKVNSKKQADLLDTSQGEGDLPF